MSISLFCWIIVWDVCSSTGTADLVDFNWDTLGFQPVPTDFMYIMSCSSDGVFTNGELVPYGPIQLSPAAGVLNYGQVCLAFVLCLEGYVGFWTVFYKLACRFSVCWFRFVGYILKHDCKTCRDCSKVLEHIEKRMVRFFFFAPRKMHCGWG
jgi:hypothetical protein